MKSLDPAFQAHLASGLTTLCLCWRLTLTSGEVIGFTDHDEALIFEDTSFEAQSGFTGSEIESSIGLAVDNLMGRGLCHPNSSARPGSGRGILTTHALKCGA